MSNYAMGADMHVADDAILYAEGMVSAFGGGVLRLIPGEPGRASRPLGVGGFAIYNLSSDDCARIIEAARECRRALREASAERHA